MKHPGQRLLEDFMVPLGLTANQVANGLGVHRSTVGRLIAGELRTTPKLAARLGVLFGVPAQWWLTMQAEHDAHQIAHRPEYVEGVTPLEISADVLLTPTGVLHLGAPEPAPPPLSLTLSRDELEKLPQTSSPQPRAARVVHYDSGSVALVGDSLREHIPSAYLSGRAQSTCPGRRNGHHECSDKVSWADRRTAP